jgi:hypothetical protein
MNPAFVDTEGPHFLDVPDVSGELVSAIHELCISLADHDVVKSGPASTYTFTLQQLGRIHCKYQRRGDAASLVLMLDSGDAETVDAVRPKKPPSLRGEAKPDSKGKKH